MIIIRYSVKLNTDGISRDSVSWYWIGAKFQKSKYALVQMTPNPFYKEWGMGGVSFMI